MNAKRGKKNFCGKLPPVKAGQGTDRTERAWKLAQLAATLANHNSEHIGTEDPAVSWWFRQENFLEHCVRRADYLLNSAELYAHKEHAYQLFKCEFKYLTVNQIAKVFQKHSWKGLTSNQTVDQTLAAFVRRLRRFEDKGHTAVDDATRLKSFNIWIPTADVERVGKSKTYFAVYIFRVAEILRLEGHEKLVRDLLT